MDGVIGYRVSSETELQGQNMERNETPIILTGPPLTRKDIAEAMALMGVDLYAELAKDREAAAKAAKAVRRAPGRKPARVSRGR
jgi:hypothetical protein